MDFLATFVKLFYLCMPAIMGNMAPVFARGKAQRLHIPLDHYKIYRGKRILGDHKTYRGLVAALCAGIIVALTQRYLYDVNMFKNISLIDYTHFTAWWVGALQGFSVIFGDALESFFKRQADVAPGSPWVPWDQIDSAVGVIIFMPLYYTPTSFDIALIIGVALLLSFSARTIAYYARLTKERW